MSEFSVVIHGHFYQPPREDPWLEAIEAQPSAAPFHDWNERIERECYRPVTAARVAGSGGRISSIVNALERISFNFGPTLLAWIEEHAPRTYEGILRGDSRSRGRNSGHGNAIAQAYHHTILPLASRREKVSEVRWGIADFRRRFGRDPVGMWLPETAVDLETLDVLAQEAIAFTILAPHQLKTVPARGLPGRVQTSRGRSIAVFAYDGALSHDVAFGALSEDAGKWAARILEKAPAATSSPTSLVSIATDGETYGHHHHFGEMGLAALLGILDEAPGVRVENFASFLERHPPREEVEVHSPTSWSCVHGVERWRASCGCKMDPSRSTQQDWRVGLRNAMDWLAAEIHEVFQREGAPLLLDPWLARDRYGAIVAGTPEQTGDLVQAFCQPGLDEEERIRARELLEMERNTLRLFTSCGWFFDDLAGIEPLQVLEYASRAIELAGAAHVHLETGFLEHLEAAVSNEVPPRTGAEIYLEDARPRIPVPLQVAAGSAVLHSLGATQRPHPPTTDAGLPGIPGLAVSLLDPGLWSVTDRRTGRTWIFETRVYDPESTRLRVEVRTTGSEAASESQTLTLMDLPEVFREAILSTMVAAATEGISGPGLRTGEPLMGRPSQATREAGLGLTLTETICAVEVDGEPQRFSNDELIERVRHLAELHHLLGLAIPFDAQTEFFRLLEGATPVLAAHLSHLRALLGFEPTP